MKQNNSEMEHFSSRGKRERGRQEAGRGEKKTGRERKGEGGERVQS